MAMDNVTLENTQRSISNRDAKSVASVMVNGKWINLSDTLEQANVKSDVGTVSKQVAEQQKVVTSAVAQANSAVAYANEAIEKSRVNQQAIVDINSAVSDAVSDAAVARSDGLRAWNAAQSNVGLIDSNYASASAAISSARTEAIAAADEAKASASAAQADIVAVRSDVAAVQADVTATRSDVAIAKSDIADAKTNLTSQAKSLSSYAAQASAAGKDIITLKSQAGQLEQDMADTKGDVSQLKLSASSASVALSDAAGDINQIKADAKGTAETIANAQGDIASLKKRADGFDTQFTDTKGDINKLQTDATGTKQTLTNAKSDIAVLQSRADGFDTKYADIAGDINQIKVDAKGFNQTLTNAKGDISTLQATATGFKNTLIDVQGNISTLQSDVSGLKKTTSDHAGNIATLQADAKTLTSQMSSAQGDISTLKQTASGFSSKVSGMETSLADANSKLNNLNTSDRNLARGTSDSWTDFTGFDNKTNYSVYPANIYLDTLQVGDVMTWGITLKNTGITSGDFVLQGSGNVTFWNRGALDGKIYTISNDLPAGTTKNFIIQTVINSDQKKNDYFSVQLRTDNIPKGGTLSYKCFFAKKGNINTTWSPAPEDTDAKITTNSAAIDQNKKAIALKADQTTVDKTNGDVQQLQAQLKVQSDQIAAKVSSSDLDAKGYATQTYTQTQIKQASDSWNANLTSVKNGLTDKYTNLHATVDGIKSTVATKADQSEVTQLSNLVQTKVSSGDFTSTTTQLKNLINQRVQVGDVISQINQEAGGDTLIQVSNGKKSLILDAGNTIVTGKAWIPVASIADLTADQIQAGTLTGSTVHLGDSNGNTIELGVLGTNHVGLHSSAQNGDQTYIDYNGIANSGTGYSTTISQGKITTGYMTVNGGGLIDFRSSGNGTTIDSQNIKFYNSNAVNGGIEFSGGNPIATARDGAVGNELRVRYDRSFALTPIKDESARICASSAAMQVGFIQSGSSTPDRNTTGLWVDSDKRHVNLGVWGADSTWARVEANTHNIHMQADKAHAWLSSDNVFHIYKDGDSSSTATKLQVDGWAWINGWVEAAGHSQHSALSTKTDIQPVDDDKMLEMINNTDLTSFLYTSDVANGETHRHIGLIIDDVHDVAQYQTPQDFIAPNGVSRDDDNMIGALFGAVKALTKRIKTLESKVG